MAKAVLKPVKGFEAFSKAFDAGKKFHQKNLLASIVFGCLANAADCEDSQKYVINYGVSVGKRTARRAVVRNRIKRLMRESLRAEADYLQLFYPESIILIWKKAPAKRSLISLNDVSEELRAVSARASQYFSNIRQGGEI